MAIAWCQATGIDSKMMRDVLADTKRRRRRGILSRHGSGIRSKIRINKVSMRPKEQNNKHAIQNIIRIPCKAKSVYNLRKWL